MEQILEEIVSKKMIKKGEVVGIGVSGGSDSMALLNYLHEKGNELDFEVVAITIDHSIRETAERDVRFVVNFCKEKGIRCYKFKVDAIKLSKEKGISIELAAREARYGVFDALLKKGIVDKIALAHHLQDQAETILLHIFRGAGISGLIGMESIRDGVYLRPMLGVSKDEVMNYLISNNIEYMTDETNDDITYSRNFVRKMILPKILEKWPSAMNSLANLGKAAKEDNEFIESQVHLNAILTEGSVVKVPTSYFIYPSAIVTRLLFKSFASIGINSDIERKHLEMIMALAKNGENGKRLNLPRSIVVVKEYDYITISNNFKPKAILEVSFKCGSFEVEDFGIVHVKKAKEIGYVRGALILDAKKLPKEAVWRFREDGDVFIPYAGKEKKLKSYLIDKKIPQRIRNSTPVLAFGSEVYAICGLEISDKVRIDSTTKNAYVINVSVND